MTSRMDSSSLTLSYWFPPLVWSILFKADIGLDSNSFHTVKSLPARFTVYTDCNFNGPHQWYAKRRKPASTFSWTSCFSLKASSSWACRSLIWARFWADWNHNNRIKKQSQWYNSMRLQGDIKPFFSFFPSDGRMNKDLSTSSIIQYADYIPVELKF